MKREDVVKLIVEGLAGAAIGLITDGVLRKFKDKQKEDNFDETLVADLTVSELKDILNGEA